MTVAGSSPVAPPAASTSTASAAAAASTHALNYNDFLTLLMAEMKNHHRSHFPPLPENLS